MSHPILALRTALRALLVADPALVALLGGERVYDEPPRGAEPPYVTFGEASARDWSTGGCQHALALVAWSRQGGDAEVLAVLDRIAALCADPPLALAGNRLVLLRVASQETARPDKAGLRRAVIRLAALTEPL
ncbi:DUF3168 domain-containing protein [Alsobacter soli]|uniref:DUF3168 domain-containing protein n=1 Tax=Alsobacter soli TaxID=2109933 RepID=UPI00130487D7|nr:DUF3168 domain-containing protein [Alsobacter soli]